MAVVSCGRADLADDACTERMGGRADERTGGRGGKAADGQADGGGKGVDSRANGRTGPRRRGLGPARTDRGTGGLAVRRSGGQVDRRMGGRAGGPGFKRPYSTRLGSLLGGGRPVHLPRQSASV